MPVLVAGEELLVAGFDGCASFGEVPDELFGNTGDLPHGSLVRAAAAWPFDELDAQARGQSVFEAGVVALGRRDCCGVQGAGVKGEPPGSAVGMVIAGADLVRDRHVGVQVGVAGAGVAVVEPGGEETAGLDCCSPRSPILARAVSDSNHASVLATAS